MLKKYLNIVVLLFLFFLQSCVTPRAEFQSKVYKPEKKAVIRYNLSPTLFQSNAVQKRRMDAELKMEDFCGQQKPVIFSEKKEEIQTGYYTNTSYNDQSNQNSNQFGVAGRQQFSSASSNVQSASGSASTVSQPIIKTYNVISFECR